MKNLKFIITFLLLLVLGVGESWGQGTLGCTVKIYLKGTPNVDVPEAGQVFITEDQVDINSINWQSTGMKITPTRPCTVYYYVKPAPGYHFCNLWTNGSGSTTYAKTNPGSYTKTAGSSSSNMVFWAVLEKDDDVAVEPTGTDGIAFNGAADTNYTTGSSSADWKVTLTFAENLTYDTSTPRSGANANAKTWISVTNKTTGTAASYTGVYTVSSGKAQMEFPYSMPVGKYNVHLPYNLFTTTSGKPTAACDFEIEVTGDDSPFVLNSVTPANGSTWEAEYKDEDGATFVMPLSISFNFSKILASIDTAGKDLSIVHTETGTTVPCQSSNIQYTNKNIASLSYGHVRNGHYSLNLPAGVFLDASGNSNDAMTITFTVTKSDLETFALPTFEKATNNLVSGTSKQPYSANTYTFEIKFASNTYGEPLAKWNSENISVNRVVEERVGSTDITAPKDYPISGCTSTFENGVIKVTFPTTGLAEEEYIKIVIPEGYVINKSGVTSATSQESLYKDGACTNPATTISFTAKRVQKGDVNVDGNIDVADVTELVDMILDKKSKNQVANTNGDNNVDVSDVTELVNIILSK